MSLLPARGIYLVIFLCLLGSCAQIVPPQGGPRDVRPPVLLAVSPDDSLFNTRVNKIDLRFDEFVTFSNPAACFRGWWRRIASVR